MYALTDTLMLRHTLAHIYIHRYIGTHKVWTHKTTQSHMPIYIFLRHFFGN